MKRLSGDSFLYFLRKLPGCFHISYIKKIRNSKKSIQFKRYIVPVVDDFLLPGILKHIPRIS